jgi:FKBP-type peptidyl-prolyl cis-trans isomerase
MASERRARHQFPAMARSFYFLAVLFVFAASPLALHAQREKLPPADLEIVEQTWPEAKRTSTGLRYQVLKPGSGEKPKPGDLVSVLYTGRLLNGTVFDQQLDPAKPFSFRLSRGFVIEGWEQGLQLMQVGEKCLFIIPYELGYGTRGRAPDIPRRATLIFEVELLGINLPPATPAK